MQDFIKDIKVIQRKMKIFSLRTSNEYYKTQIQKLINLTEPTLKDTKLSGTKHLPFRIQMLENKVNSLKDLQTCNNKDCNEPVFSFDYTKLKFCCTKCQSIYNNTNMSKESRKKAAESRNYKEVSKKRNYV